MKQAKHFGWVLALSAIGILAVMAMGQGGEGSELEGKPAPDFTLKNLEGQQVSLANQKGNVVVIDFWATWCPPCRASLPHLQEVSDNKEYSDEGLKVYAVNLREKPETIKTFMKNNKLSFPVLLDDGTVADKYGVEGIPTTAIVGRDGKVTNVFVGYGPGSAEKLEQAIEKALAEPKPEK